MKPNLIFDLGLHKGEDTEFYLKKGFNVVAVDADPQLCEAATEKFRNYVKSGQLHIVNRAIAEKAGVITFYRTSTSEWGTVKYDWVERNIRKGQKPLEKVSVKSIQIDSLIEQFGVPYYLKIDIEGMDIAALKGIRDTISKPKYISIESDKVSFSALRNEFAILLDYGYTEFKIVQQENVSKQKPPRIAAEGVFAEHNFLRGSTGLFGAELPGEWVTAEEALEKYKSIFLRYHLTGDDPLIKSSKLLLILRKILGHPGWYDTHARRVD